MKRTLRIVLFLIFNWISLTAIPDEKIFAINPISQAELEELFLAETSYAYIGAEVCTLIQDLPQIHRFVSSNNTSHLNKLCTRIEAGNVTAPFGLIEAALQEAAACFDNDTIAQLKNADTIRENLENYYSQLQQGDFTLSIERCDDFDCFENGLDRECKRFDSLVVNKLKVGCLEVQKNMKIGGNLAVNKDVCIGGNLTVNHNETVVGNLTVLGTIDIDTTGFVLNGCQDGPITIGTNNATSITLATNGCTPRMIIDAQGDVTILEPDSGVALTVTGTTTDAAVEITGHSTLAAPALILNNNPPSDPTDEFLTIDPLTGVVTQGAGPADCIINGCQPGPITIGTNDGTSITLVTSCTDRLIIDGFGAVSILPPAAGPALTVTGNTTDSAIVAVGNGTPSAPALTLFGNPTSTPNDLLLTIDGAGVVRQGLSLIDILVNGCQPGPLTIGTSDDTSLTFVTSCTDRLDISGSGNVTVQTPDSGPALTVNGNGSVANPALVLTGNPPSDTTDVLLTIDSNGVVKEGPSLIDLIVNGCMPGPITIGTNDGSTLTFVTSCTDRMSIDGFGDVTINAPVSGPALTITGNNTVISPALVLNNNPPSDPTDVVLTIDVNGVVKEGPSLVDFVIAGCHPGPLTLGTSDNTSFNLVTSCTDRLVIAGNGDVTVNLPDFGPALTVTGDGTLPNPALILQGNPASAPTDVLLTIDIAGIVKEGPSLIDFVLTGCHPGPLTIGTSDDTSLTFVTSCTDRMDISGNGNVTVQTPDSGPALTVNGNSSVANPALVLNGNPASDPTDVLLTIDSNGVVKEGPSLIDIIVNGCMPGPITIGTNDGSTLTFVTSCTDRMSIDGFGDVTINAPVSGPALTITGNNTVISPALVLNNNPSSDPTDVVLTIDVNGVVKEGPSLVDFVIAGCHPGPLTLGTSDDTSFNLVTSCTDRLVIAGNGDVTINLPDFGPALTVTGDGTVANPALILNGNPPSDPSDDILTIDIVTGVVKQGPLPSGNCIQNGCQPGPIVIGTSDDTSLTFVTSCTDRIVINPLGNVTVNQSATGPTLTVNGSSNVDSPALVLNGNPTYNSTDVVLTIDSSGVVKEGPSLIDFLTTGCHPGPLTLGTSDDTSFTLVTSCTDRVVIAGNGDVTVVQPDFGPALTVNGDSTTISPALVLNGNPVSVPTDVLLTIDANGVVKEGPSLIDFVMKNCQPGPLTLGTSDDTSFTLVTSCTDRIVIAGNGDVTVVQPDFGPALTVNGDSTTISPALVLNGNPASAPTDVLLTIDVNGVVKEGPSLIDFVMKDCQPGPLRLGTSDDTSFTLVTSCTDRIVIAGNGDVTVVKPDFGPALTVNGDSTTISPALILNGNPTSAPTDLVLTIDANGVVKDGPSLIDFVLMGCQPGPLTLGTSDDTSFNLVTSCTDRMVIAGNGDVTINQPDFGPALTVTGDSTTISPALVLINNPASSFTDFLLTIDANGVVKQGDIPFSSTFVKNGCMPGPVTVGTSDQTSLHLVTSCTDRIVIDQFGAVTVNMPDTTEAAQALTVTGNIIVPEGNTGGTLGRLLLGGANPSSTNVKIYEFGTRNFFAGGSNTGGSGAGNTTLETSAIDNIAVGTDANTGLTTASNTIAIGTTATASMTDAIAIGDGATAAAERTIVLGSKDSTSTGVAPIATVHNAIAIGSGSGTQAGAAATNTGSIAIGGSGGTHPGAIASGDRSIALGNHALSSGASSITLGSTSGVVGGHGPKANGQSAIAIGSGNGANRGPIASAICSIAIGSADVSTTTFTGATATQDRAIAIGVNATASGASAISIGGSSGGVGGTGPVASNTNAIAIGTASAAPTNTPIRFKRGALSTGLSSIAIGGSEAGGFFDGATAVGDYSIAIGVNAFASAIDSIAFGSSSTAATGGPGPIATGAGAIAIGSANTTRGGAFASGAQSVAIGGASVSVNAATATGARSVAIGNGANTAQADAIILGNAQSTAVKVGIGTPAPSAKLHVVGGVSNTPVAQFDCFSTSIIDQIVITNLATIGTPMRTLQIDASNRVFGSAASSARFKTNIRPIEEESVKLHELEPIIFDYRPEHSPAKNVPGFIAEEVYKIFPSAVALDLEGKPYNIHYHYLHALAISEIQKQQKRIEEQETIINEQSVLIAQLMQFAQNNSLIEESIIEGLDLAVS